MTDKDRAEFEANAEGDYIDTPISVLKYITYLETKLEQAEQENADLLCINHNVAGKLERAEQRLAAAEAYIELCPGDPDITDEQWQAYEAWKALTQE